MRVSCGGEGTEVWRLRLSASGEDARILIDGPGVAELGALLERATRSVGCRVLVLEGEGGRFCEGMDLDGVVATPAAEVGAQVRGFGECLALLRGCPKVVLAVVDGDVAGGGVGLAAAADLVIASARSRFTLPELTLGLLPALVMPVLLGRVSAQRLRQLCLFGAVDAREALWLGLVDRLVAGPDELERGLRAAIKAALRASPAAVAGLKQLQREMAELPGGEALVLGARRTAGMLADEQTLGPIRAFLAGEPLPWFSRYRADRSRG